MTAKKTGYLALVPARGGSKGIKNKNLKLCAGRPLVEWTLRAALDAKYVEHLVLSTDDKKIAQVGLDLGIKVEELRPASLSEDETSTEAVMAYEIESFIKREKKIPIAIILLQPTSPGRSGSHIDNAVQQYQDSRADSLLSVCENHHFFWTKDRSARALYDFRRRPRRQDIEESDKWYRETGAIYISDTRGFQKHQNRLFGKIELFEMRIAESIEIDSLHELIAADAIMKD